MAYNFTQITTNSTGIVGFTQGVNNVLLGGWLGVLILIGILAVTFLAFMTTTSDAAKSLSATSFIGLTISLFMFALELLPRLAFFILLAVCAITLALTWKNQ